jgi:hypothetical protein
LKLPKPLTCPDGRPLANQAHTPDRHARWHEARDARRAGAFILALPLDSPSRFAPCTYYSGPKWLKVRWFAVSLSSRRCVCAARPPVLLHSPCRNAEPSTKPRKPRERSVRPGLASKKGNADSRRHRRAQNPQNKTPDASRQRRLSARASCSFSGWLRSAQGFLNERGRPFAASSVKVILDD